jgi:hypothetical protein
MVGGSHARITVPSLFGNSIHLLVISPLVNISSESSRSLAVTYPSFQVVLVLPLAPRLPAQTWTTQK